MDLSLSFALPRGAIMSAVRRVYFALLILLAATAIASYFPLGKLSLGIALGFAVAKAALVVWNYMELRNVETKIRLIAAVGLVWFFLLLLIIFSDYLTRGLVDTFTK